MRRIAAYILSSLLVASGLTPWVSHDDFGDAGPTAGGHEARYADGFVAGGGTAHGSNEAASPEAVPNGAPDHAAIHCNLSVHVVAVTTPIVVPCVGPSYLTYRPSRYPFDSFVSAPPLPPPIA